MAPGTAGPELASRILDSMSAAVLASDLDGRVVFANRAAARALGCGSETILGQEIDEALGAGAELRRILHTLPPAEESRVELRLAPRTASAFDAGLTVLRPEGGATPTMGTIVLFRDLDQLGALEAEMLRNERLGALGRVVGGLAHELRNPLAAVQALVESLSLEFDASDGRREYLERITNAVGRINAFVTAAVAFAEPAVPKIGRHSLADLVASARRRAGDNGSHVVGFATPALFERAYVAVDAGQIARVLDALLGNARDAAGPKGRVEIELRGERLGSNRRSFRVDVRDDGPGVDPSIQGRIFDPYFTTKPGAMGMGLATAHSLSRLNGGTVELRGTPHSGACFALLLPEVNE